MAADNQTELKKATFAGGCFWCIEAAFDGLNGVTKAVSGYTGGKSANPTYGEVCSGVSGHLEVVQVTYDPDKISYEDLVEHFWRQIDPTDTRGQFGDRGSQYQTAIFYHDKEQHKQAEKSKNHLEKSGHFQKPIVTKICKATPFYPAEEYHQGYHCKNPLRYKLYKMGSGRDRFLKEVWKEGA